MRVTLQRIEIDESFPDDFLTEACGVPVTTRALGHVIVRTFPGGGTGPAELFDGHLADQVALAQSEPATDGKAEDTRR